MALIMGYSLPINLSNTMEETEQILIDIMNNLNIYFKKNKNEYSCETFYNFEHILFEIEIRYTSNVYIIYFKPYPITKNYREFILCVSRYILEKYNIVWNPNFGLERENKICDTKMDLPEILLYLDSKYKDEIVTQDYMNVRLYFDYCGLIELNPTEPLFTIKCPYFKHILKNPIKDCS